MSSYIITNDTNNGTSTIVVVKNEYCVYNTRRGGHSLFYSAGVLDLVIQRVQKHFRGVSKTYIGGNGSKSPDWFRVLVSPKETARSVFRGSRRDIGHPSPCTPAESNNFRAYFQTTT